MITENDPILPRKVDLEKNPSGTELKIAQHRELEKHGKYVTIPVTRLIRGFSSVTVRMRRRR